MRSEFSCAAAFLAMAGAAPAMAADLAVRTQRPVVAPPPYVSEWVGFYLGIHGGGGWDRASFESSLNAPIPGVTANSGVFGGHAGYNWQWGRFVGGLEVDFDGADIKERSLFFAGTALTKENRLDELASARARAGYALLPNLLAYATAGAAWGHSRLTVTVPSGFSETAFVNQFGWVAGAGLEYRLFEHLLLRAEYLHYDLGQGTANVLRLPVNIKDRVDVVRGGISYKF